MTAEPRRVLLGHISAAHGLRGEVLVKTYTGDPRDIAAYGPLTDETGAHRLELKVVRVTDKGVIARVAGVADRTAAERIKGAKLYVARDRLPVAAEREYYHADLIGLDAVSEAGERIGHVVAVQNFGAGDLIEIRLEGSIRTELVPFTDAAVPVVDVAAGRVVVRPPDLVEGDTEERAAGAGDDPDGDATTAPSDREGS